MATTGSGKKNGVGAPHWISPSFPGLQMRVRREQLAPATTPASQAIVREGWPHTFLDETQEPDPGRLFVRRCAEEADLDEELVAMATIELSGDGRSLRTFTGKRNIEVAIMPCPVSHHVLHVEGSTAEDFVIRQQTEFHTSGIAMEAMRIRWTNGGHDPDAVLTLRGGGIAVREIKRDENDLRDPKVRNRIAMGAEVLRRGGIDYSVVFRREIFRNGRHRRNCRLFASRGFAHVKQRQLDAVGDLLETRGAEVAWGDVIDAVSLGDRIGAVAIAQALVIRRRVEIDLSQRIHDGVAVVLHPPVTIH